MVLRQEENGETRHEIKDLTTSDLPEGDILLRVGNSSPNYKDAMAVTGKGKIVRSLPMVPEVDMSGTVEESDSPDYEAGEKVVLTGWSAGERY